MSVTAAAELRGAGVNIRRMPDDTLPANGGDALPLPAQHALPSDGQSILELAARSMFQLFSSISQGMFLVDRTGRIV